MTGFFFHYINGAFYCHQFYIAFRCHNKSQMWLFTSLISMKKCDISLRLVNLSLALPTVLFLSNCNVDVWLAVYSMWVVFVEWNFPFYYVTLISTFIEICINILNICEICNENSISLILFSIKFYLLQCYMV